MLAERNALTKQEASAKRRCEEYEIELKVHSAKLSDLDQELTLIRQQHRDELQTKDELVSLLTERGEADARKMQKLSHTVDVPFLHFVILTPGLGLERSQIGIK